MKSRIWYDAEFLEDGHTIELISIAMIREADGAELHLINDEAPWDRIAGEQWLCANVVPHLPLVGDVQRVRRGQYEFTIDRTDPRVQGRKSIADQVEAFILAAGPSVRLRAWYAAYDHVVLSWLWGRMIDHPNGMPMWTGDVRQDHDRLGNPPLPEQETGQHDTLADARQVRAWDLLLDQYELAPR